jgi:ketosteroid isomerase-like protein
MSDNLDLVRSIYADWERGDFSRADWADPDIEYVIVGGPAPGEWTGLKSMASAWRDVLSATERYRTRVDGCREIDDQRVLVLTSRSGRGKTSGVDLGQMMDRSAGLFHIRNGKVTRLLVYMNRDRALADLGLED